MDKIKLGVLGLGSRTTTFYVTELNRIFNEQNGGYSTCPFILLNTNFNRINSLLPSVSEELNSVVQSAIKELKALNVEQLIIPNITLHETVDHLEPRKNVVHPVYLTAEKIKEKNISKIVLVGSEYTMNSEYIHSILKEKGIEIEVPQADDQLQIDEFRKHVYAETETKEGITSFHNLLQKYSAINQVVLACTELSIFQPKQNTRIIDMAEVQITTAVNTLMSKI
jgi:aspartate racemase